VAHPTHPSTAVNRQRRVRLILALARVRLKMTSPDAYVSRSAYFRSQSRTLCLQGKPAATRMMGGLQSADRSSRLPNPVQGYGTQFADIGKTTLTIIELLRRHYR
jgi:hypothetical protein